MVMAAYFAVVILIGVHFGKRQRDAGDYFLGRRELPWWAVMLSIVATETSALTVISVPGLAARGDLTFLQLPLGYLLGRIGVALWLLPGYFRGDQQTAYERLEERFGPAVRRLGSAVFMVIRALGDSVRVYVAAIPLVVITGWSEPTTVVVVATVVAVFTLVYTWAGGIRAVIWVDVMQMGLYTLAALTTIVVALGLAGGLGGAVGDAMAAGKLHALDWGLSLTTTYTLLGGLVGGALLSAASHGTDHMIVQRLLATRSLRDAQKALIASGAVVIVQFAVFLLVGTFLWAAGADDGMVRSDTLFPAFVVEHLPVGISGLVVAGILAAAMSTVSSSLNSLASATTNDFYAPLTGNADPRQLLRVGRRATLVWALVLLLGALSFVLGSSDQPAVELALSIASITYGALLGTYILGGSFARARQRDAVAAILTGSTLMLIVVLVKPGPFGALAWPWYVPLGTIVTMVVGLASSMLRRRVAAA